MSNARIDRIAWVLIYAGLLACGLGWTLADDARALGSTVLAAGLAAAAAGVLLIWIRSRRAARAAQTPTRGPTHRGKETSP